MAAQYFELYEHPVLDLDESLPVRRPSIRHLVVSEDAETALGGCRRKPGDTLGGSYFDLSARDCAACFAVARKAVTGSAR